MTDTNAIEIYTDGACRGNPGVGGWGASLQHGEHLKLINGAQDNTTNNRMELTAAIEALKLLKKPSAVILHTDSTYVKNGITEWMSNWKKKNWRTANKGPVKNVDLWQALDALNETHNIDWRWVKGHSGNEGNERADQLANDAIDAFLEDQP